MRDTSRPRSASTSGVSRRTVVKGVAWATPVVTVAAAAPVAAASVCSESVTGVTQDSWSRPDETFVGCPSPSTHFDVSVRVTVQACAASSVRIRLYDLASEPGTTGRRSRLWWADRDSSLPYLFIEKEVEVPALGTIVVTFASTGDVVRWENTQFSPINPLNTRGSITAPPSTENDGIHVNPCYFWAVGTSNIVAKLYYSLDGGPWSPSPIYVSAVRPAG
jgi:hypothetical protein